MPARPPAPGVLNADLRGDEASVCCSEASQGKQWVSGNGAMCGMQTGACCPSWSSEFKRLRWALGMEIAVTFQMCASRNQCCGRRETSVRGRLVNASGGVNN